MKRSDFSVRFHGEVSHRRCLVDASTSPSCPLHCKGLFFVRIFSSSVNRQLKNVIEVADTRQNWLKKAEFIEINEPF